jgi:hypothetical protein
MDGSKFFQNDSGLPQGPADPVTAKLMTRQTACVAGMIGGGTWEGATHVWHETP